MSSDKSKIEGDAAVVAAPPATTEPLLFIQRKTCEFEPVPDGDLQRRWRERGPQALTRYNCDCLNASPADGTPTDDEEGIYCQRWVYLAEDVEAQLVQRTSQLAEMQTHRDHWRWYAYGTRDKPQDYLDGNMVDPRPMTFLEINAVKLGEVEAHLVQRTEERDVARREQENRHSDWVFLCDRLHTRAEEAEAQLAQMTQERDEAKRTVKSIVVPLGWISTPPRGEVEAHLVQRTKELAEYQQSFALCEVHTPDLWEGDGTCTICEAVHVDEQRLEAEAKLGEAEATLTTLRHERDELQSDFDSFQEHHRATEESWHAMRMALTTLRQSLKELAEEMHEDDRAQGDFYVTSAYSEWAKRLAQLAQADGAQP